jgi:signal transduction histidine kinase
MTISYVWMTVLLVLLVVLLAGFFLILVINTWSELANFSLGQKTGVQYAYAASLQSDGLTLNPRSTFQPGQAYTLLPLGNSAPGENAQRTFNLDNLIVPYVVSSNPNLSPAEFALLIAPDGRVVASSYPARYPANTPFSVLFPHQVAPVAQALQGTSIYAKMQPEMFSIAATIWGKNGKPIGALYMQGQGSLIGSTDILLFFRNAWELVAGIIFLVLLITTPIGGLFGLLTTRGLVRRIRHLAEATTNFAGGDYHQRVQISRQDEVGKLEHHFNQMANQLIESTDRQQELAGQNARLAERARISRELHDAISQDLFSLRMLAYGLQAVLPAGSEFQTQVTTLERTTSRMISEMRALLLELRPAQLEQLGLAEALKDLAASYNERLAVTVTTDIAPATLQPEAEHALLRVAQEALSNAVRHAHASRITLVMTPVEQGVSLTICDNGEGFAFEASQKQHGLGLNSMQERIHELRGTFSLQSAPGQGTEIHVYVPPKEDAS